MTTINDDALVNLRALDDLFDTSEKWMKGEWGEYANGVTVLGSAIQYDPLVAKECVRFCLEGGAYAVGIKDGDDAYVALVKSLPRTKTGRKRFTCIPRFNDHKNTTFADVRKVVRDALKLRKRQVIEAVRAF